jgi:type VI secretion system protein ImpC
MAQICAAMHAPFITAAAPSALQFDSWGELSNPRDLTKIFGTPEYAAWRSLRESDDSRYLGLAMPRFLGRTPYGANTDPVEGFDFEEDTEGADSGKYLWCNAAYAMATNINKSFKLYGWCSRIRGIESGGAVEDLPTHSFPTDDGGVDMKCPTEIAISDRREAELAKNGFMPLIHKKNSDFAAFIGAQSLQKPQEYEDPDATANANLAARLPYLFATCRFAHYLKCIVRDKIGSFKEKDEMQDWLNKWIMQYVDGDPANSSESIKARHPLAAAEVVVEADESNPGYYRSRFYLRPHYQLEGLTVSLRLVSKLPSAKGG